jgi:hypothetical protein
VPQTANKVPITTAVIVIGDCPLELRSRPVDLKYSLLSWRNKIALAVIVITTITKLQSPNAKKIKTTDSLPAVCSANLRKAITLNTAK